MQQRRSHPLFSRIGCGSALLLVLSLGLILQFRGGGPFSPGPLTALQARGETLGGYQSHAEFEEKCALCHAPWRGPDSMLCESCHTNVTQERVAGDGLHGQLPDVGRCHSCHTDHAGRLTLITQLDERKFDHTRLTGYSLAQHALDYAGDTMSCSGCHPSDRFSAQSVDCVTCHEGAAPSFMQEHQAQFGADCLECHDGGGRLVDFDHEQIFALEGAHAQTACGACHIERTFEGTPRECAACHDEPVIHAGLFGLDCARCHTEVAWAPAQLTAHTFPLDHGEQFDQACELCHTTSYTTYTCYSCHEHDPAEIREKHVDEGIFEFEDCIACHPTGKEHEGEND